MSIYQEALKRVQNGETFHINFEKRSMKVGRDTIIDNGVYDTTRILYDKESYGSQILLNMIEERYKNYKYSLPSERSDSKRRKYFKALPVDELTDEQMIRGMPRETAQFVLEAFILCMVLRGDFIWNEEIMGKWFWQSKTDNDLILLRGWIDG